MRERERETDGATKSLRIYYNKNLVTNSSVPKPKPIELHPQHGAITTTISILNWADSEEW